MPQPLHVPGQELDGRVRALLQRLFLHDDGEARDLVFELDNNANEGGGQADDDHAFVDGSVITEEPTNELAPIPKPYWAEDCVAIDGPTPDILESNLGAFKGGADWMEGAWINWAEE